ncbi:GNAT family N-acetyltransferase [Acaryochloris marina NIES-2412]|uniref:GNAT family N-acetyltransferase n=1 Tax=Acaryochloris marina TaxID=155978 RepID=UPI004058025B
MQLIQPTAALQSEFLSMVSNFQDAGETRIHDQDISFIQDSFLIYIHQLEQNSFGIDLKPGFVPATTFWLISESNKVVGESRLRHRLTPSLEEVGGHIGYMVRPADRGQGYGTKLLALTLIKAQPMGIQRVLVTCNTANQASARVIQKNGGVLISTNHVTRTGQQVSQYWIELGTMS